MAWRGTFGCWPCRLLSFYHRKVSFSLSGRVMSPGEVLFFPETLKLLDLYIIWHVCTEQVLLILCHCRYRCFSSGFYEATFLISSFALIDLFSYNLCSSDTPHHPAPVSSCSLSPLFITFSVHSRRPQYSRLLSFSLPPRPSVRWENWPHKKWKGLFKRSSSVMKTYYCIPWCAARGGCCWPTAILFS